jgi:hypothetical protein
MASQLLQIKFSGDNHGPERCSGVRAEKQAFHFVLFIQFIHSRPVWKVRPVLELTTFAIRKKRRSKVTLTLCAPCTVLAWSI